MDSYDEKLCVANSMIKSGGGFLKALGNALIHADSINTRKIKETFTEEWEEYKKLIEVE